MARIRTYALDNNVTGSDYWIGTDGNDNSNTKNFSPNSVAKYLNENEIIDVSNSVRFKYDTIDSGQQRKEGTLSFQNEIGATVPMSNLTSFVLSKKTQSGKDVSFFLNVLPTTKVILHKADDINLFGLYKVLSVETDILEPNFFNVSLEFISGHGSIEEDKDYIISLIDLDKTIPILQLTKETFNYASSSSFTLSNTIGNILQVIINATSLHPEGYSYTLPSTVTILNELYSGDVITIVYNYLEEFLEVPNLQRVTNVGNHTTNSIVIDNTPGEWGDYTTINTINDLGAFQSLTSPTNIDYQSEYSGYGVYINEIYSATDSREMYIESGTIQTSYTDVDDYNEIKMYSGSSTEGPVLSMERNYVTCQLKINDMTESIILQIPNKTEGTYTIATTSDVIPFNPSEYDLDEFANANVDPFAKISDIPVLGYTPVNTYFVNSVTGNNTTGIIGDKSKPFLNVEGVLAVIPTDDGSTYTLFFQNSGTHVMVVLPNRNFNFVPYNWTYQTGNEVILDFSSITANNLISTVSPVAISTYSFENVILKGSRTVNKYMDFNGYMVFNQTIIDLGSVFIRTVDIRGSIKKWIKASSSYSVYLSQYNTGNLIINELNLQGATSTTSVGYLFRETYSYKNITIDSITGTGSMGITILCNNMFINIGNGTFNGTINNSDQNGNNLTTNFLGSTFSSNSIIEIREQQGIITGSILESSPNGLGGGFERGGAILKFVNFNGKLRTINKYTLSAELHFYNCNIVLEGVLINAINQIASGNVKFLGVNTFKQNTPTALITSVLPLVIEKRGANAITTNSTSLGTNVTILNSTPLINEFVVETTSGYTLTNADSGGIVIFKTTAAQTLTIPTGLADGFECTFVTLAGVTLTVSAAGVTLNNNTSTTLLPQLSFTLKRMIAADTYIATGNL